MASSPERVAKAGAKEVAKLLLSWEVRYRPLSELEKHFFWSHLAFSLRVHGADDEDELVHLAHQSLDKLVALIEQAKPVLPA